MPLESATYIDGLNTGNPAGTDQIAQTDDHLRLIKTVLKATFPNITGPVTLTQASLNQGIPAGIISLWSGSVASIPAGWGLCDGSTYTKVAGGSIVSPNLVDVFIRGAGSLSTIGATGGATSHSHTITVDGTTLTTAQIPAHAHGVTDPGHTHSVIDPGHNHSYSGASNATNTAGGGIPAAQATSLATSSNGTGISLSPTTTGISINNAGGGGSHSHTGSSGSTSHLPPYYVLAFVIKL